MFPQELLDKLKEEHVELKQENKKLQHDHERPMLAYKTFHSADSEEYIEWVKGCKIYEELEEENKKLKKEHIQNIMKLNSLAKELYREMKYALGYGEFDEPDRKVMYDEIKKLKEQLSNRRWKTLEEEK